MIYKCKNCGGNAIYAPSRRAMFCPYCDGVDCEQAEPGNGSMECASCGAPMQLNQYDSAYHCESCGNYIIIDERIQGENEPHLMIPFKLDRERAKEIIREEFGKKLFLPSDFLSEARMNKMEGIYVPFFMYDYFCDYEYAGTGRKVRTWRSGNTEYTETSIYHIERSMDITFEKIPADASILMDDKVMDLLEPFQYQELESFQSRYMSGFLGEMKNMESDALEPRARKKAREDAEALMNQTISGYASVTCDRQNLQLNNSAANYALLPVWDYTYKYHDKEYHFKLNGQTGKMVGEAPISWGKVAAYGLTLFGGLTGAGIMLRQILEVLL
ncbi:MAG: hypothetical protein E7294_11315 [Lachnospiraceae bacterium]|jgi:DNA-directed RNA polymerase subunit RPC12/RpoP|nr:hypothetical protein [Lachnospiraceae bacterium]